MNVETIKLEEFHEAVPSYAILSHTWGKDNEEVSFRDVQEGKFEKDGALPIKLDGCCKQAKEDGYRYIWIDTCCIDKTNSVELHEAINSMFRWYMDASICYAYLSDVPIDDSPRDPISKFFSSRWFERGWTLQELLAPPILRFYNSKWRYLGTKGEMCDTIERITGIPSPFLLGIADLQAASVAQRMSWAARRVTKRKEDIAYSLLGIFGVTMPMIYGEGGDKAFRRLQEQIMKDIGDDSILAWGLNLAKPIPENSSEVISRGILAAAPSDFANCGQIARREQSSRNLFNMTSGSLQLHLSILITSSGEKYGLLKCGPEYDTKQVVGIPLTITSREPSNEYIRPQGRYSVLLPNTASEASIKLIRIRNEHQSMALAATNQRYWFHVQESVETNLELIDVVPRSRWHKERALIEMATVSDDHVMQQTLARFRHKEEGSHDFVILLEFGAQTSQTQARCHVMISSRDTSLEDVARKLSYIRQKAFGKKIASNGILNLQVTLEPIATQPMFIIRPTATSSSPEITIDVTWELRQLDLTLEIEIIAMAEGEISLEEQSLGLDVEEKSASLDRLKKDLEAVEDYRRKLDEKRRLLIKGLEDGVQEMDQLNIRCKGLRQGRESMSKRRLETQRCLNELLDNTIVAKVASGNGHESDAEDGHSTLSWAVANGHEAVVRLLFEKGVDVESKNKRGETPLIWAAANGHEAVVRLLLDKGANIESKDNEGQTSLSWAAASGYEAVVRVLLDKGGDIESKDKGGQTWGDKEGWTPLIWAAANGHEAVVRLLLDKGADVELKDSGGQTLLSRAAANGHEAVVRLLLLVTGTDIESKDKDGRTPLIWAAVNGHEAMVRVLLDKGADIESKDKGGLTWKDKDGRTPLIWAALNGHEAVARLLLDKGADVESKDKGGQTGKDKEGWTPLIWAAANRHEAVVRLLLDKGANIESKDKEGRTSLSWAAASGYEAVVRVLLEKGADIESKDKGGLTWKDNDGRTPLIWAAVIGHEAVVRLLLDKGANIESKDNEGRTSLSWAAAGGHEAVVRLLLDMGADIESKEDLRNWTPLRQAAWPRREAVVRLLLDRGADINSKDTGNWTSLTLAAAQGHEAMVKLLLERGAFIEPRDVNGYTPLSLAAEYGHRGVVRLLLEAGADIKWKNNEGRTPLNLAAKNGHHLVVKMLESN